ncbi:hypothetical protein JHD50_10635 [Sulfurimonas sp. MAG313]|nr:hypothetical protein [Sulfurimonas sp. MAG313]MDF1881748.1 hypothetical protein [Sulfurimonas sp. MAG313]
MTDFVASGANYSELTFKFTATVASGSNLVLVNNFETNSSLTTANADAGVGMRTTATGLVINAGLDCAENVTLEVINSKDQSGQLFEVPNTNGPSSTGVLVTKGVYIELGAQPGGANVDGFTASVGFCPTFSCNISIKDSELAFGSATAAGTAKCPTCTDTTLNTDYTCDGAFTIKYNGVNLLTNGGVTLTSIDLTTNGAVASMGELASIKGELVAKTAAQSSFTIASSNQAASVALTTGINAANDNNVFVTYTADTTSIITPNKFNMVAKVNGTLAVDTITDFMEFKEEGKQLGVSYMSANPAYRSFVRVSVDKPASVDAVVTTEDGVVSSRTAVTKADGSAVALTTANGGALVVEGADILRSVTDAGFTGLGQRFNVTLYVKSSGNVDAVAYQLDGGSNSQRYLPVSGATGGGKN